MHFKCSFCFLFSEWYGYHFPELVRIVSDNLTYTRVVFLIKNRKDFSIDQRDALESVVNDTGKTEAIFEAMKTTIGMSAHKC